MYIPVWSTLCCCLARCWTSHLTAGQPVRWAKFLRGRSVTNWRRSAWHAYLVWFRLSLWIASEREYETEIKGPTGFKLREALVVLLFYSEDPARNGKANGQHIPDTQEQETMNEMTWCDNHCGETTLLRGFPRPWIGQSADLIWN